jgi:hypothetical protein
MSLEALTFTGELGARNMEAMMSIAKIAMGGMAARAEKTVQSVHLEARRRALLDQAALNRQTTEKTFSRAQPLSSLA